MTGDYARQVGVRLRMIRQQRGLSLGRVEITSGRRFRAATVAGWEHASRMMDVETLDEYTRFLGAGILDALPPDAGFETRAWEITVAAAGAAHSDLSGRLPVMPAKAVTKLLIKALRGLEAAS